MSKYLGLCVGVALAAQTVSSLSAVAQEVVNPEVSNESAPTEAKRTDPIPLAPPEGKVPLHLLKMGSSETFSPYAFVMDKSTRTLSIWQNTEGLPKLVSTYPADVGRKTGKKTAAGDRRTPEGIYFFQEKLSHQNLNLDGERTFATMAFTTDYPNFFDRVDKTTGNGIWLHAIPDDVSLYRGSRGCIVVRNSVISTLTPFIQLGETPIIMSDKVEYVDPSALQKRREDVMSWLDRWRESWETKKVENYMQYYHADFKAMGMDKTRWQRYKSSLSDKYAWIKVQVREPSIFIQDQTAVVRFYQVYTSDKNADFGEKTLYVKLDGAKPQIIGENWKGIEDQTVVKRVMASTTEKTSSKN